MQIQPIGGIQNVNCSAWWRCVCFLPSAIPVTYVICLSKGVTLHILFTKGNMANNMHPIVLMEVADQVSEMLTDIFNSSLESGQVHHNLKDWRVANVTPLFKKGSREELGNYRPVSLTSVVGKVLETLIRDQMRDHLNKYKLIKGSQHGFIKGSSCLTNLLEFCEAVSDWVDEGKAADKV